MKSKLLHAIITNECQMRSFSYEDIVLACKSAEEHFRDGRDFVQSIHFGIQLAEALSEV